MPKMNDKSNAFEIFLLEWSKFFSSFASNGSLGFEKQNTKSKNLIRTTIELLLMAITIRALRHTFEYFAIGNPFDDRCIKQKEWKNEMRKRKPEGRKTSNIRKQILIRVFFVDLIYGCRQAGIQLRCIVFHLEFNETLLLAARCHHSRILLLRLK